MRLTSTSSVLSALGELAPRMGKKICRHRQGRLLPATQKALLEAIVTRMGPGITEPDGETGAPDRDLGRVGV